MCFFADIFYITKQYVQNVMDIIDKKNYFTSDELLSTYTSYINDKCTDQCNHFFF